MSKNKIAVLIGDGANSIEIPCMIFENWEKGLEECNKIFPQKGIPMKGEGYSREKCEEEEMEFLYFGCDKIIENPIKKDAVISKSWLEKYKKDKTVIKIEVKDEKVEYDKKEDCYISSSGEKIRGYTFKDPILVYVEYYPVEDVSEELGEKLYKSYYDGCGGVSGYILKEVEFGESLVRFDLD